MATWRTIAATETDPEAPITSALMKALADNPRAIAEGAGGADKILDAALSPTVTTAGITWVNNRIAGSGNGGIGTYAFLNHDTANTSITAGSTFAGSILRYSGVNQSPNLEVNGGALSGTWRAMGTCLNVAGQRSATLFLRIA